MKPAKLFFINFSHSFGVKVVKVIVGTDDSITFYIFGVNRVGYHSLPSRYLENTVGKIRVNYNFTLS